MSPACEPILLSSWTSYDYLAVAGFQVHTDAYIWQVDTENIEKSEEVGHALLCLIAGHMTSDQPDASKTVH